MHVMTKNKDENVNRYAVREEKSWTFGEREREIPSKRGINQTFEEREREVIKWWWEKIANLTFGEK